MRKIDYREKKDLAFSVCVLEKRKKGCCYSPLKNPSYQMLNVLLLWWLSAFVFLFSYCCVGVYGFSVIVIILGGNWALLLCCGSGPNVPRRLPFANGGPLWNPLFTDAITNIRYLCSSR
jgi:hypothetical protein